MDAALGSLVLSLSMAAVSIAYFIFERVNTKAAFFAENTNMKGVFCAVIAGVGVAAANIFLAHSYHVGGKASTVAVLQNGFSISVTILVGMLVLGEIIRPLQALGILFAFGGIILIAKG